MAVLAATLPCGRAQQAPLQDKPFAEHDRAAALRQRVRKQDLAISVANNLMKAYDPDKVAIEVVAFGPGIDLLRAGKCQPQAVESLIAQGVKFDVCLNTSTPSSARPASGRRSFRPRPRFRSASGKYCR